MLNTDHAESCLTVLICYTGYRLKHPKRALTLSVHVTLCFTVKEESSYLLSKGPNIWRSGINNVHETIQSDQKCFISSNNIPSGNDTCVAPARFPAGVSAAASWICVSRSLQKSIGSEH